MSKEPRPLAEMQLHASALTVLLADSCERLMIAGSVRRRKPVVADIELVAIPKMLPAGLFGDQQTSVLHRTMEREGWTVLKGNRPDAKYHQIQLPNGLQVDIFTATQQNWGLILMIRTGCAEFSQAMLTRWKACQRIGPDGRGSVDGHLVTKAGQVVETRTEEEVFRLCKVPWIAPEERTGRLSGGALYAGGEGRG